ncbi:MAG: SulP family inorganic anion transporter, partial [Gemmataceae bacterium]
MSPLSALRADLIAGLTVAAVAVPQAMAYALIAGVEPRHGLYTAVVMTAVASVLGSSAHLINGPTNAISLVVLGAVAGLAPGGPAAYHQAVFALTVLVGLFQVLIYFLKLGDLTRYVSESVILGFMLGAGFLVAVSQVPNLLGLRLAGEGEHALLWRLGQTLAGGTPRPLADALGVGAAAAAVLLKALGRRAGFPVPDMLMALIAASAAAQALGWSEPPLTVPAGLPGFAVPAFAPAWLRPLAGSAAAIALLGLLEALAIAKSIAARTREPLDYNRQCLAEGLANLAGGFFQCMPGSGSLTRSAINFQAGAVTRWSGVASAAAVAACLLLFADLARFVPRPALAGLLVVTAWRLVDWGRLRYSLRATGYDRVLVFGTALAAVFVSIEFSILIGVFLSFVLFVPRASRMLVTEFVVAPGRVIRERQPGDPACDRLAILGLEGEFFFGAAPELTAIFDRLRGREGLGVIVLRLKRARNPDMVCLELLQQFLEDM